MDQQGAIGWNGFQNTANGFAGDIAVEVQDLAIDRRIDTSAEFDNQGGVAGRQDAGQDTG